VGRQQQELKAPWFYHAQRVDGWQSRLRTTIDTWSNLPFEWGKTDCFCFAGACIGSIIGSDPMSGIKGLYKSKIQAYRVLSSGANLSDNRFYKSQTGDIVGFWSFWLGDPKPVLQAQTGDVVFCRMADGSNLTGVVSECGRKIWVKSEAGCLQIPISMGTTSWRV
jgi:hypothetical protein